jgi:hypothetical protein
MNDRPAKTAVEGSYEMVEVGRGARVAQGENISWIEGVASLPDGKTLTHEFTALLDRIAQDASLDEDTRVLAQDRTKALAGSLAKVKGSPGVLCRALLDAKSWFGRAASWAGSAVDYMLKSAALLS